MVDEVKSLRRNKKVAGIEDPIVIVQRLLNVYRQLHILDEKQREDFDKMVLQQPPEIRHMCSTLPGGSLLQEYVDELEEKFGVAPDQHIGSEEIENGSKENILANALADDSNKEAPVSAPAAVSSSADNQEFQKQMLLMMQAMQKQAPNISGGAATIKADSGFAKEIASAISGALAVSDEKRRKETAELTKSLTDSQMEMTKTLVEELGKRSNSSAPAPAVISEGGVRVIDNTAEITKAITESQLEMAKMFLQHNAISASNSNANNANNIQINNAPLPNSQELIGDIIKAQSQLFREMAKEQTKELSTIISAALQESSRLSNKTLVNTLTAFQKENMKFFKQQAKNQTVIYQQAPMQAGNAVPVSEPVYQYVQEEPENSQVSAEPSYIKKVFGNMFNRMHNQSETGAETELSPAANEPVEYEYVEVPVEDVSEPETSITEEQDAAPQISEEALPTEEDTAPLPFENDNVSATETLEPVISDESLDLTPISPVEKKKKKKKKKKKGLLADSETFSQDIPLSNADKEIRELLDFGDINSAETENETTSANGLDISLFDSEMQEEAETLQLPQEENTEADKNNFATDDLSLSIAETKEQPDEDFTFNDPEQVLTDFTNESSEQPETDTFENLTAADEMPANIQDNAPEALSIEPNDENAGEDHSSGEFAMNEDDFVENNSFTKIQHSSLIPDLTDKEAAENLFNPANEFVEDQQPLDLEADYKISLDTADENVSDNENGEWEWEYEETPEDESDTASGVQAADESEDGEWEWEYEEVPEDESDTASDVQAADENEEGEWEWEYEEVPEDESDTPSCVQAADENEEGEWEWEYEEVPEDESETASGVQAADESEDGEWEWEYEEIPEDEQHIDTESQSENINLSSETVGNSDLSESDETLTDLSEQEDVDFSDLFNEFDRKSETSENFIADPYDGGNHPENSLNMSSLQAGDLYFQEEISASTEKNPASFAPLPEIGSEAAIPDWSEEENQNEPYHLNSDLKP